MNNFYVAFDDSTNDPTFCGLDSVWLVEGPQPDEVIDNPCSPKNVINEVNLYKLRTESDIRLLARALDLDIKIDGDGQMLLCSRVFVK